MVANFMYDHFVDGVERPTKLDAERLRYAHYLAGKHMKRSSQWGVRVTLISIANFSSRPVWSQICDNYTKSGRASTLILVLY